MNDDMRGAIPYSLSAEQSVIGGLLLDNDAIDRCVDLRAEHFFRGEHRAIFAEIVRMIEAGKPADPLTLADALPDLGIEFVTEIALNTPSAANIGRYAEIVRERAQRRGLLALSSDLVSMVMAEKAQEAPQIIESAQGKLDKLAESATKSEPVAVADDLGAYVDEMERRREGGVRAIPTGFPDLDEMLSGGIRRGEVVLIAARPKVGKTALALAVARNVAVDHAVLVLEMEMPRMQLHDRNCAALGRINLSQLLNPGRMTDDEWSRFTLAIQKASDLNLFVDDQAGLRMLDVRNKARMVKRKHGLDLLVIDYLQLMEADGDNRNAQIETITRGIKALAKELNIGVLLLSQLNREVERRADKRPLPSDLRDSGSIEQDCDVALFMYRDEVYDQNTPDKGIVEVHVGLNRQGATGTIGLSYIGEQTRYESLAKGYEFGRRARPEPKYSGLRD